MLCSDASGFNNQKLEGNDKILPDNEPKMVFALCCLVLKQNNEETRPLLALKLRVDPIVKKKILKKLLPN